MKTINLSFAVLFCVCFGHVLNAQTIKHQINNQDIDKNRKIYKSSDVLESEKRSSSSANIDHDIQKKKVLDNQFRKITIISPNSVIGDNSNKLDENFIIYLFNSFIKSCCSI